MWINDTMAYLVGSFIGRTPFSKISPKKTWEGTLGGIFLTVLLLGWTASSLFDQLMPAGLSQPVSSIHWYILALLAAIAGTAGDLLESKFKRMAGIKDSGSILPGHGGYLDRFDSLLLATPIVWIYLRVIVF
jgi:phosphatidate cytidylyltransferase